MGKKRIRIDGSIEDHPDSKPLGQLRSEAGWSKNEVIVIDAGDGLTPVSDDTLVEEIPEESSITTIPDEGRLAG